MVDPSARPRAGVAFAIASLCVVLLAAGEPAHRRTTTQGWESHDSGVSARFRGISAVDEDVAWASGTLGTVVRTVDAGATWDVLTIPGAEELDLRDVDAFDENVAYALSIGTGADSRIFKTVDGGATWTPQFVNDEPRGFFDAMSFWDRERGIAVSDSIDGAFYVLVTVDGGAHWTRVDPSGLPAALPGEGYFAASGTNVATWGEQHAWFGTGAAERARVGRSIDGGRTWQMSETPLPAGPSTGIFSIAFRDPLHGIVVGGDYQREDDAVDNAAITSDGGRTWTLVDGAGLSGFRSAVGYFGDPQRPTIVAVGPSGADISRDGGRSWQPLRAPPGLHTLSSAGAVVWAAGDRGLVARFGSGGR